MLITSIRVDITLWKKGSDYIKYNLHGLGFYITWISQYHLRRYFCPSFDKETVVFPFYKHSLAVRINTFFPWKIRAYHQKIAVITPFCLFEILQMPFGLHNATFHIFMDQVFHRLHFVFTYFDAS